MAAPWENDPVVSAPWENDPVVTAERTGESRKKAVRSFGEELKRQLGLAGRYAIEGIADTVDFVASPVYSALNYGEKRVLTPHELGQYAANRLELPEPETATERVVGDASRMLVSGGGLMGAAGKASKLASGVTKGVLESFSERPAQQAATMISAGLAGGATREAGGGPLMQGVSSMVGGIAGGVGAGYAPRIAKSISAKMASPSQIRAQASEILSRNGIDIERLPLSVKNEIEKEVVRALRAGEQLDEKALVRLADFKALGISPTLGQLTRDPVLYSKELNLRGMPGAEPLQQRFRQQAEGLYGALDDMVEVKTTPYAAGDRAIGALSAQDAAKKAAVQKAYQEAKKAVGIKYPLDKEPIAQKVAELTDEFGKNIWPQSVKTKLKEIGAIGKNPKKQFTIEESERLLKAINANINPMNPPQKAALNMLKKEVQAAQYALAESDTVAKEAADAFKKARSTARKRFAWHDAVPAAKAVAEGKASPDDFLKKYIINGKVKDIKNTMASLDPATQKEVRSQIAENFLRKAGFDSSGEIGGFTQKAFNNEIMRYGKEKLIAIMGKDGYDQLTRVGRVAAYITKRPPGESVNESKTAATMAANAMKFFNLPILRPYLGEPIENMARARAAKRALDARRALLQRRQAPARIPASAAIAPFLYQKEDK